MFGRGTVWTALVSSAWLAVMAGLFGRDLVWEPEYDPPPPSAEIELNVPERFLIVSERADGPRTVLGEAVVRRQTQSLSKRKIMDSDLKLDVLPGGLKGSLIVHNLMRRRDDGRLDGFEIEVRSQEWGLDAKITGSVSAGHCIARLEAKGLPRKISYRFPVDETGTDFAGEMQGFARLPGLEVGRTWKIKMITFKPLIFDALRRGGFSRAEPDDPGASERPIELTAAPFEDHVARVVGRERIRWNGGEHEVHAVLIRPAAGGGQPVKLFVALDGRVLRQELDGLRGRIAMERTVAAPPEN